MDWNVLWWLLVILLAVGGLLGVVLPALPGVPLVFLAVVLGAWINGFEHTGWFTLGIFAALTLFAQLLDFIASAWGTQYADASAHAFWGATIGAIVGIFFGIPGLLLGPFVGAVLGEMSSGRGLRQSGRAGLGAWLGMILGTAAKLTIAFLMIGTFVVQSLWR